MHIIIGNTPIVKKDPEKQPLYGRGGRGKQQDRRQNRQDRRKSVRGDVIVSLSVPNDRRMQPERRRR
ncbi:MAG: hypothetical protein V1706_02290 [Pseudomonadota bacterium]